MFRLTICLLIFSLMVTSCQNDLDDTLTLELDEISSTSNQRKLNLPIGPGIGDPSGVDDLSVLTNPTCTGGGVLLVRVDEIPCQNGESYLFRLLTGTQSPNPCTVINSSFLHAEGDIVSTSLFSNGHERFVRIPNTNRDDDSRDGFESFTFTAIIVYEDGSFEEVTTTIVLPVYC